ncbi:MAG: group II intron reverse transcriptase/maturase [Paraclostridium sp.]
MINRLMATIPMKKQTLRNNEYYDIQETFDKLYHNSKNKYNYKFYKLMDLITDERNIRLAYRNIKNNNGSDTEGVNGYTLDNIDDITDKDLVEYVRKRLQNYHPQGIRRVEIPKDNGKIRPIGIPTIEDRIIQQCIKQVLEPICEGKFYNHSYGFRPNRSAHHAISRSMTLANRNFHYVIDVDIKGFFDNVNHGKLLKQIWSMGIQDKQLLCIISKMLKAPIEGIGVPTKGTPQGGILSPLLSNIVLNELDWWIAGQWEHFKTKHDYTKTNKYKALKKTKMKELYIVRYADDFKIFTKNHNHANRIFKSIKMWLKERLHLDISEEKSKIVNLKTNYSEFLGIKMKVHNKGNKLVVKSHLCDKAKIKKIKEIKNQIIKIQKSPTCQNVGRYNSMILGMHNYYKVATHVNLDFSEISYLINKTLYNRTKGIKSKNGTKSECYKKLYGNYKSKIIYIREIALFPISGIKTKPPMNFSQDICDYTKKGRGKIHKDQQSVDAHILHYIMRNPIPTEGIEYNDNRISLYVGQNGICPISGEFLGIGNMECHHKTPRMCGGTDEYSNLIFLKTEVHKLVNATTIETIEKYKQLLNLDNKGLKKLNKLRTLVGNFEI